MIKVTYELNGDFMDDRKPQRKTFKTDDPDAYVTFEESAWVTVYDGHGRLLFATHSHKIADVKGVHTSASEG